MRFRSVVLASLVACGGAEAPDTTAEDDALLAGEKLTPTEVAQHLRHAGFDESTVPPMVCAAKYESSYFTEALHRNRNGSVDYGLFQVNDRLWMKPCGASNVRALYDPDTNAACAKLIFENGGLRNWYGYLNHKRECDSFTLPLDP
jgi:hypothetical protein